MGLRGVRSGPEGCEEWVSGVSGVGLRGVGSGSEGCEEPTHQGMPTCTMRHALCIMHYGLCTMHYALCTVQYARPRKSRNTTPWQRASRPAEPPAQGSWVRTAWRSTSCNSASPRPTAPRRGAPADPEAQPARQPAASRWGKFPEGFMPGGYVRPHHVEHRQLTLPLPSVDRSRL